MITDGHYMFPEGPKYPQFRLQGFLHCDIRSVDYGSWAQIPTYFHTCYLDPFRVSDVGYIVISIIVMVIIMCRLS